MKYIIEFLANIAVGVIVGKNLPHDPQKQKMRSDYFFILYLIFNTGTFILLMNSIWIPGLIFASLDFWLIWYCIDREKLWKSIKTWHKK